MDVCTEDLAKGGLGITCLKINDKKKGYCLELQRGQVILIKKIDGNYKKEQYEGIDNRERQRAEKTVEKRIWIT